MKAPTNQWQYTLVTIACLGGAGAIFFALLTDGLLKMPSTIQASKINYETEQAVKAERRRLTAQQQLDQQQSIALQQQQQQKAQLEQQRIRQEYDLEKLAQQKPLTVPQHSAVNAGVECLPGTNAVNMRSEPAGSIRYELACGESVWATDTTVLQRGVSWRLIYRGGLPGWVANALITQEAE